VCCVRAAVYYTEHIVERLESFFFARRHPAISETSVWYRTAQNIFLL
jgi:hypothetical protein